MVATNMDPSEKPRADGMNTTSDSLLERVKARLDRVAAGMLRSTPTPLNRWLLEISGKEQSPP